MGFDEVMIFESYARAQELDGDLDGSIETLEELTRVFGSRTLAHFQLAQVYEKANRDADARARYENCLRLWVDADSDYPYPDVARARLAALGN